MGIRIIVDSTADLTEQVRQRVEVVPLTIRFADVEYIDGITIDSQTFYEKLVESDVLPTTSQATPFAFEEAFSRAVDKGDHVVCITCSSKLSGTYQSAVIAAGDYPRKVYVVDSETVSIGAGILTEYALTLVDRGLEAEEIARELTQKRGSIRVLALLDTLEYLKKGGRISKTAAFAGGILNIKPVVCIDSGEIRLLGKARGSRQGNNLLAQEIGKAGGVDFAMPMLLGYTGISDALLRKYIADSAPMWEGRTECLPVRVVGSTVGTHAGPGAVAAAFFAQSP